MADAGHYDIDTLLEGVVTLPSMPETLARVTELLDDPNCALSDVAQAISVDPSIALKTLRLVNSAYYGIGQEIATIEHAVVLLGVRVIRNLVLTATVLDTMKTSADRFLRHCVGCAVAMRTFAEHSPLKDYVSTPEEAFVFGLLHDIGKVIFEEYLPEEYARVPELCHTRGLPWYQAERLAIGVDHAQLGGRLAERWKLTQSVVGAIRGHHDLENCGENERVLAATLTVADFACAQSGLPSHENQQFDIPELVWHTSAIDNENLLKALPAFLDRHHAIDDLIQMSI